ncbi:MAG: DEAD/DEAH box helicase [Microbacteriaceae bacterium]|nr:DEAD/DEAH box helicase [Microbacteriaceae bacterium]
MENPKLKEFEIALGFTMDSFQLEACTAINNGLGVLVAAPTGAGKTVIAQYAIYLATRNSKDKVFYTTPMKALSNQKYSELKSEYGEHRVGLLTGDNNINSEAQIVVMTTEVLRNMLYEESTTLKNLRWVVMDEVHYLADRFRGAVWEEVIIHLPQEIKVISLSATVSNAEEFGEWLQEVRGNTKVVVSEHRPIPLTQHVYYLRELSTLFTDDSDKRMINPELVRILGSGYRSSQRAKDVYGRGKAKTRAVAKRNRFDRVEVIEALQRSNLLPVIYFVFSRAGCEQAATAMSRSGLVFTTADERKQIEEFVLQATANISSEDLWVLNFNPWFNDLRKGFATHHAGLIPLFKEIVEVLYQRKLIKIVFATETLALGINMPAKTVVIEKLEKYNGIAQVPITPGEYTQFTGRAGRRGIDTEGHSVIIWNEGMDINSVASLASKRTYPLNSSFRPSYNMAINLLAKFDRKKVIETLQLSFAQFEADRSVVSLANKVTSARESLRGYERSMACHLGDFSEYSRIRREISDLERQTRKQLDKGRTARLVEKIHNLREDMRHHPCHQCKEREQHARWGERYWKLKQEIKQIDSEISRRTNAISRRFDQLCNVLTNIGYLETADKDILITEQGEMLKGIYAERDLLISQALLRGIWQDLNFAEIAAISTLMVYEPRLNEPPIPRKITRNYQDAQAETFALWSELQGIEIEHKLPGTDVPSTELSFGMYRWASGDSLEDVLAECGLPAGDFVRWSKQVIDILDQIYGTGLLGNIPNQAIEAIRRGVVVLE